MSENPQQQQVQVRFDESKMETNYANTIRSMVTGDEVVLDFGMNLPMQGPNNEPMMMINIGSRVIMNWVAAKRLAMQIGNAVRQYEERNGEIPLGQTQGPEA